MMNPPAELTRPWCVFTLTDWDSPLYIDYKDNQIWVNVTIFDLLELFFMDINS